jgi:putative ATPase
MAIEDVGLADPDALHQALAAKDTYDFLGALKGSWRWRKPRFISRPRLNPMRLYGVWCGDERAKETGSLAPPKIILNAPTKMMKEQEYGAGYRYDHDEPEAFPDRIIFRRRWAASSFTIRRSAALSAR